MIIIAYDFSSNKTRAQFAKFLKKYGRKIQYSVYEVNNSPRVLQNIMTEIELKYKKRFKGSDSILIFQLCKGDEAKVKRYGYASNEEQDIVIFE
ncbi:CRISPR-associated endonuclease Cas2 [Candidatus Saccharibacteria bacterium QS_5_54_17]|nr:MAG: CRISPR-associated endonuclease Cas2 [Candidatus Saccharibacteria bacterium QS_5_54_17]